MKALQNRLETIKHKFLLLENSIDFNKPKAENIHAIQENFQSICGFLFPENEKQDSCKNLKNFLENLHSEHKENPNVITIDLNEKVRTRNQKKGGFLKENKKIQNCQHSTSDENFEDSESKASKQRKKFNMEDEDYKPAKEIDFEEEYSDFENKFTNRKRKVKQEVKKVTTAKKSKKEMLKEIREMKEYSILAKNSIEFDVFF